MFDRIKKVVHGKKLSYTIVFGFLCLIFVFIGIPVDQTSSVGGAAAIVNNHIISWAEYQSSLETLRNRSKAPVDSKMEAEHQNQLRRQAMDTLLNTELIYQSALKAGLVAADKSVQNRIVQIPLFQEEGRFQRSRYLDFLSARKFSASYFEDLIRKEILVTRFQNFLTKSISSSFLEKEKQNQLKSLKVKVSYVQFKSSDFNLNEKEPLEQMVKEEQSDQLNQVLKDKNLQWVETSSFDLTRLSLPDLSLHKRLFDEVIKKLPETGFINKVLSSRDQSFIVRVNSFQKEEVAKDELNLQDESFMDQMISQMMFYQWVQSIRESAKIQFNPRVSVLMVSE